MTRRSSSVLVSILAVAAGLAACDSLEIDGQRRGNDTPGAAPGPAMPEPVPGLECTDPAALRPSDMRRLTGAQIERTLRAALGDAAFAPLADTLALLGRDAIHRDPNDLAPTFDPSQLETIDRVSRRVGAVITASDDNLKSVAGACSTATPVDAACVTDFVTRFGRQMFRRPLAPEEVASYADVFKAAPSGREGIADVAAAMVLAPDFLYHVELGAGQEGTPSEFELTPHEVAARVSYFLTDGPPDGALMAAADDRSIEDATVLGGHVDRLLGSDAGKAKVRSFVRYWLTLERFQGLPKAAAFLAGVDTEGLPAEMVRELDAFVDYIAYTKRGSYRDLLTSRRSGDTNVFNTLFDPANTNPNPAAVAAAARHKLLVDRSYDRYKALQANARLSAADRTRFEAHVASMTDLQKRLASAANCSKPTLDPYTPAKPREILWRNQIDAVVSAMACDMTRVASMYIYDYKFGTAPQDYSESHGISHDREGNPLSQQASLEFSRFKADQVLYLLKRLSETTDVDGSSMLDNTVVLWTSELSNGNFHTNSDLPVATFGGAGGALKTGYLMDFRLKPIQYVAGRADFLTPLGQAYNRLLVTLMRAMGMQESEYIKEGDGGGFGEFAQSVPYIDTQYTQYMAERNTPLPIVFA